MAEMLNDDDYQVLDLTREGRAMWITINNPPLNIITAPLLVELLKVSQAIAADSDLLAVVLQSANPDFFMAHFDVEALVASHDATKVPEPLTELNVFGELCERFRTMDKVVMCKIAGRVGGGGSEIAMACDMRFGALGRAVMNQMEVPIGILPGGGGTQRLPGLVGAGRAAELILGGLDLDAETGERWGYFNRSLPPEEIDAYVDGLARRIASFPPNAVRRAKASLLQAKPDPVPGLLYESSEFAQLMADPVALHAMAKFMELGGQTHEGEMRVADLSGEVAAAVNEQH